MHLAILHAGAYPWSHLRWSHLRGSHSNGVSLALVALAHGSHSNGVSLERGLTRTGSHSIGVSLALVALAHGSHSNGVSRLVRNRGTVSSDRGESTPLFNAELLGPSLGRDAGTFEGLRGDKPGQ